jgi:hypothetical protein
MGNGRSIAALDANTTKGKDAGVREKEKVKGDWSKPWTV